MQAFEKVSAVQLNHCIMYVVFLMEVLWQVAFRVYDSNFCSLSLSHPNATLLRTINLLIAPTTYKSLTTAITSPPPFWNNTDI